MTVPGSNASRGIDVKFLGAVGVRQFNILREHGSHHVQLLPRIRRADAHVPGCKSTTIAAPLPMKL